MPSVRYDLTGDNSDLDSALEETIADLKKLDKVTRRTDSSLRGLEDQGEKTAKGVHKTTQSTHKLKAGAESAKQAATALGGKMGEMGGRVEAATRSMTALASALGPAGVVGIALIGAAALVAGLAIGMVKAGKAVVGLTKEAAALVDELEDINKITKEGLFLTEVAEDLDEAALSLEAADIAGKGLYVTLAALLAPAVKTVSDDLTGLKLAASDALQTEGLSEAFQASLGATADAAKTLYQLAFPNLGKAVEATSNFTNSYQDDVDGLTDALTLQERQAEALAITQAALAQVEKDKTKAANDEADATDEQSKAYRGLAEDLKTLKTAWVAIDFSEEDGEIDASTQRLKEQGAAWQALRNEAAAYNFSLLSAEEQVEARYETELAKLNELAEANRDNLALQEEIADRKAQLEDERDAQLQTLTDEKVERERMASREVADLWVDAAGAIMQAGSDILDAKIDNLDTETRAGRREARKLFNIQKGLNIAMSLAMAAAAIVRQYADLPLVAAIPASVVVAATTVAEIATIASTKPEFPIGTAQTPDHTVMAALQPGEAVLNRPAVRAMGGPEAVNAVNSQQQGKAPGGIFQILFRGSVFDAMVAEVAGAPGLTGELLTPQGVGFGIWTN